MLCNDEPPRQLQLPDRGSSSRRRDHRTAKIALPSPHGARRRSSPLAVAARLRRAASTSNRAGEADGRRRPHRLLRVAEGPLENFAERLVAAEAHGRGVAAAAVDLATADPDRLVEHPRAVFIVATYAGGSAVPGTEGFFAECTEMSRDFRVEKTLLAPLSYAVFGCGNSEYPKKDFNACARKLDRAMRLLGARRLLPRREGDDLDNALGEQFDAWRPDFWRARPRIRRRGGGGGGGGARRRGAPAGQAGGRDAKGRSVARSAASSGCASRAPPTPRSEAEAAGARGGGGGAARGGGGGRRGGGGGGRRALWRRRRRRWRVRRGRRLLPQRRRRQRRRRPRPRRARLQRAAAGAERRADRER